VEIGLCPHLRIYPRTIEDTLSVELINKVFWQEVRGVTSWLGVSPYSEMIAFTHLPCKVVPNYCK
jgi:hypothetical protein